MNIVIHTAVELSKKRAAEALKEVGLKKDWNEKLHDLLSVPMDTKLSITNNMGDITITYRQKSLRVKKSDSPTVRNILTVFLQSKNFTEFKKHWNNKIQDYWVVNN